MQSNINKHVGAFILLARRSKDLTQSQLSKMSGVSRVTICYIESKRGNPNFESVYRLLEALGKNLNDLESFIRHQKLSDISARYLSKSEFTSDKILSGVI